MISCEQRRATAQAFKQLSIACKDCGQKFSHWDVFKTHLHQHALEEEEKEEEEAQTGDNKNPAADLLPGRDEDKGGHRDEVMKKLQNVYSCIVCGKAYTYLVSFRKHMQLHEKPSSTAQSQSVQTLHKYECPECGMLFIRQTRLLGHLRTHRSQVKSKPPRCDQCNKDFTSIKRWMIHINIHKERPFWCLSCARGFRDELSLDKHMQSHSLRRHKCDICHKSFPKFAQLINHYNIHNGAKLHQCSFCGKTFSHAGNLIRHKKKHLRVGSRGMPLGIKSSAIITKKRAIRKRRSVLTTVKEEPEMVTNMEELLRKEESVERSETQKPREDAEFEDHANSEESDCGEPIHYLAGTDGPDPPDESKSKTGQPEAGQELDQNESQDTHMHREHKYWEWECFECDMGFDDVAELHLHYMKHASGELPFPQDDIEG